MERQTRKKSNCVVRQINPKEDENSDDKKRKNPFDDIIDGIGRKMEEFSRNLPFFFSRNVPDEFHEFPKPFVWGIKMDFGPDGQPEFEQFGNTSEPRFGKKRMSEERSPLVDILEEVGQIRVIAELPGVSKEDIELGATETSLTIEAKSFDRQYSKVVSLPARIKPETAKAKLKNGLLEVIFTQKESDSDHRIVITDNDY